MDAVSYANEQVNEKRVKIHRIAFETRDREGVTALVSGNVDEAMENFRLAERHGRKLVTLLQSSMEKGRALEGSLEMSDRLTNLRALKSSDNKRTAAIMLGLLARSRRDS